MARLTFALLVFSFSLSASAHEPNRECQQVRQRIDIIGPVGNDFRQSYRRTCNRPRYLVGKLAYLIAPSSQEAIAWHKAEHQGAYEKDLGRIEPQYFYPKPWEALRIGPRVSLASTRTAPLKPVEQNQPVELIPNEVDEDEMDLEDDVDEAIRPDLDPNNNDDEMDDLMQDNDLMQDDKMEKETMQFPDLQELTPEPIVEPETLPLEAPGQDTIIDSAAPQAPAPLQRMKDAIKGAIENPVGSGLK